MGLTVNIKRKDPRFKGDKPKFYTVVSGDYEHFDTRLCRQLEMHGLSPMGDQDGDFLTWSGIPQIGAGPHYMASLLQKKFGAKIHRDVAKHIQDVVGERTPSDGLQGILGRRGAMPPGRQKLEVLSSHSRFVVNCDADDDSRRAFLEGAGWIPVPKLNPAIIAKLGTQPYATGCPLIAANLEAFFSDNTRRIHRERMKELAKFRKRSEQHTNEGAMEVPAPEGKSFLPFQQLGISVAVESPGGALIADDMGLGKAQPLDAKILTLNGWRRMGDIKVGDSVIGSNGAPTLVTGVFPQGEKEIFKVTFSDGSSTECCDEHLWAVNSPVRNRRENPHQIKPLSEIRESLLDGTGNRRHYIPMVKPVRFPTADLRVDPYEIGAFVALNQGFDASKHSRLLISDVDQRLAILQGIMDSAGSISEDGDLLFSSSSEKLVSWVADIAMSLGGTARRSMSGTIYHSLFIRLPHGLAPFRLQEKADKFFSSKVDLPTRGIAKVESIGFKPAQCIRVDAEDHLYVTDDFIVTHNTMQGIGVINAMPWVRNVLVISQANMRIKWVREIEAWKVDDELTVAAATGKEFPDTNVVAINYDIVAKNIEALRSREWDLIICDEAHNMKNPEAQRTQSILGNLLEEDGAQQLRLSKNGKIVHLTGTPMPNKISDMWPLLTSTRPDIWGRGPKAFEIFKNRYCPPILIKKKMKRGNREWDIIVPMDGKPIREIEFQLRLKGSGSVMLRKKSQIEGLPKKFRTPLELDIKLSKAELEAMREVEFDALEIMGSSRAINVKDGASKEANSVIEQITRINPDSPQFHEMARVRRNLGMLKAPHCAKFILDELAAEADFAPENRTKTVVFAHHKDVIQVVKDAADARDIKVEIEVDDGKGNLKKKKVKGEFLVYDGSVGSAKKKQALVDRFQEDDRVIGMIISLSGNSGITLTAAARMRVIEPDWSPSNLVQIEDRIWRIGQEKNVDIGYMFIPSTLDARIGMTLVHKMDLNKRSLENVSFRYNPPSQTVREDVSESDGTSAGGKDRGPGRANIEQEDAHAQRELPLYE